MTLTRLARTGPRCAQDDAGIVGARAGRVSREQLIHAYRVQTRLDPLRQPAAPLLGKGNGVLLYTLGIAGPDIQ